MDERPYSKLSRLRMAALDHIVKQMAADGGLLLLVEQQEEVILALPSYASGSFASLSDTLKNSAIRIRTDHFLSLSPSEMASLIVEQIMRNQWHKGTEVSLLCKPVSGDHSTPPTGAVMAIPAAILVLQGSEIKRRNIERYAFWIGSVIRASRDERFKDAILKLHAEIGNADSKPEPLTDRLTQLLRDTIGPCEIMRVRSDGLIQQNDRMLADPGATWPGRAHQFDKILDGIVDTVLLEPNSLHVPHSELVYRLENTKFTAPEQVKSLLQGVVKYTSAFKLTKKQVPGYLQSHFSASDHDISKVIVDMAQSLNDQSEMYVDPHPAIDLDDPGETVNSTALESDIKLLLGNELTSLTVVDINQNGEEVELSPHVKWTPSIAAEDYGERLQQFAASFYRNGLSSKFDQMQIGIDITDAHRCIEFHFPSSFGHGKLIVIDLKSPFLAERTLDRMFHILRAYFHKMKRMEMLAARARILIETRHSIIHYIHIASNGLKALRNQWNLAAKNERHWLGLRNNKIFIESIGSINWAIQQSTLILQSGRFTFDSIDSQSIRRTNYNIETLMLDCRLALEYEIKRKGLTWIQKIAGFKPSHLYGDPILLQIALLNLFDNAVKYAPNGTNIVLTLVYDKDSYRLSIANRGDQVLAGKLELLLKFGFRGRQHDQLNTRSGTGLGLPVAQRILTAHSPDAKIVLSSIGESGFGLAENTFSFAMPYLTGVEHWPEAAEVRGEDGA